MFQNFTGNSRRPRHVNLSGQNLNPFATATGARQTVVHAQQERQQRQRERARLIAARTIQRIWRGYRLRLKLSDARREEWDNIEAFNDSNNIHYLPMAQLKLIVCFFNCQRKDDLERIVKLSSRAIKLGTLKPLTPCEAHPLLLKATLITLKALNTLLPKCPPNLLQFLVNIVDHQPLIFSKISKEYYKYLSHLLTTNKTLSTTRSTILTALKTPLDEHMEMNNSYDLILDAYTSFAIYFLTTPELETLFGPMDDISSITNISLLSFAIIQKFSIDRANLGLDLEGKIWLLAHYILLSRQQRHCVEYSQYMKTLLIQIASLPEEFMVIIDNQNLEPSQGTSDNEDSFKRPKLLPDFVQKQLLSLVTQESISDLLSRFSNEPPNPTVVQEKDISSSFACYILTLMRLFPRLEDEIRMWLYLGSMRTRSGVSLPTLKYLWQATYASNLYSFIKINSDAALMTLRHAVSKDIDRLLTIDEDREWHILLLFLELYAFVLRFTDDEEFLSGDFSDVDSENKPVSRLRQNALPLEDVKQLTVFLKNLAFAMYYHYGELIEETTKLQEDKSGTSRGVSINSNSHTSENIISTKSILKRSFAGILGESFKYVRTIVTNVMCMLYERDSRRKFLPKDHWLMTSQFDMDGFIPAVALEEERQHELRETEDLEIDDSEDEDQASEVQNSLFPSTSTRHVFVSGSTRNTRSNLSTQKRLATIGPRLEVLQNMPFIIPFETRVQIFQHFVFYDQLRRRNSFVDPDMWRSSILMRSRGPLNSEHLAHQVLKKHHAKIRRNNMFEDAYQHFYSLGDELKEPIRINFVDQFDTVEAGIDGGGVTKEFLTSVITEALCTKASPKFFVTNDQNLLYPNPTALDEERENLRQEGHIESSPYWKERIKDILQQFEFIGRIVGKCLYEGILIDIGFASFFLLKWPASGLTYRVNINDIRDLDEKLYEGLLQLKNYNGNVEEFSLDFTTTDTFLTKSGKTIAITRDLIPNGSTVSVTNENRPLYVSYVARHRLQVQPYQQTQAFLKGLSDVINPAWISMFNRIELQTLISGDSSEIDVEDLRRNTLYGGIYQIGDDGEEHETIKYFWKVMKALDDSDRRKVLKFITSSPRAPLLGFSKLNPLFSIRDSGSDEDRLPSTSTCVNLLKLPRYSSENILKQKLLYAINSGAGFDLS
ncbi:putative iq and hect domain protein [Erysiphe neolycopersici]|uniref:HECT-type E3 ubiquitin transferase n=1 Tax=Erysiphe neolycopersici TaxID=212602 RepID=A0A420I026_9PEZI|nr:putative iq and hect domain protein [Erysiphe neolycopersici]